MPNKKLIGDLEYIFGVGLGVWKPKTFPKIVISVGRSTDMEVALKIINLKTLYEDISLIGK